jgi:hypothetical protein
MKRVFKFKKGNTTDWDELMMHFLEDYLCKDYDEHNLPMFRKDWKVTITVEELKK